MTSLAELKKELNIIKNKKKNIIKKGFDEAVKLMNYETVIKNRLQKLKK